jgi:Uma2 family endonuclease
MSITLTRKPVSSSDSGSPRRWTREEVHRLYKMGFFDPEERFELIGGELLQKMTQNRPHARCVMRSTSVVEATLPEGFHIQQQMPIILAEDGEPEPDIAVIRGQQDDYPDHPTQDDVVLLIEVSESTLNLDRGRKAAYYAQAGIADYWIVNLVDHCLEVRRNPVPAPDTTFGFTYSSRQTYREGESVSPLFLPQVSMSRF